MIEPGYIYQLVTKDREETMSFRQIAFLRMLLEEHEYQGDSKGITLHPDIILSNNIVAAVDLPQNLLSV